ncbi:MAG: PKD domain-containing protein [Deinococcales bacterium]
MKAWVIRYILLLGLIGLNACQPTSPPQPRLEANFVLSPARGTLETIFYVDASASKAFYSQIESYDWDFGDGSSTQGKNANHQYRQEGSYEITLTVTNDKDQSAQQQKTVTVTSGPSRLRFVHALLSGDALSLSSQDDSQASPELLVEGVNLAQASTYAQIKAGKQHLEVTDQQGFKLISDVTLAAGGYYTLLIVGKLSAQGDLAPQLLLLEDTDSNFFNASPVDISLQQDEQNLGKLAYATELSLTLPETLMHFYLSSGEMSLDSGTIPLNYPAYRYIFIADLERPAQDPLILSLPQGKTRVISGFLTTISKMLLSLMRF